MYVSYLNLNLFPVNFVLSTKLSLASRSMYFWTTGDRIIFSRTLEVGFSLEGN